jgi:hypothetical protein
MTTIATDGFTIAADSMTSYGNEPAPMPAKKIQAINGKIYGVSGDAGMLPVLARWVADGARPELAPKLGGSSTWFMIVIDDSGAVHYCQDRPYPCRVGYPFCIGSGQEYALGAMKFGATPAQAVAVAAQCNYHTGGHIDVIDIAAELARMKAEMADADRSEIAIAAE